MQTEHIETVVIGGGQAGLSTGYHLKRLGVPFVILDANERVGDVWRNRWDSLRLFTPAKFDSLDGMPVPVRENRFITKDEMADYLERYAQHFDLPVRTSSRVNRLTRDDAKFRLETADRVIMADRVVVAMGRHQTPKVPGFATELRPDILQMHSLEYRNPGQLRPGGVLIVGAGNSGAEIAKDLAGEHDVWMSGRDVGAVPFNIKSWMGRNVIAKVVLRFVFHHVMTVRTPIGRKARPKILTQGGPLIRTKRKELAAMGVKYVGRTTGVRDGLPVVEDGAVLDVANVIWCTGFSAGYSWLQLPVLGELEPRHKRGVSLDEPGLYFVGLEFQYSFSSEMVHGVGREAHFIAETIARERAAASQPVARIQQRAS